MSRNKDTARALIQQKRRRRQWLTFLRVCRYGLSNFRRNAWLTVAATLVMTITLLIIFATFVAQQALRDTASTIGKELDRSIYLKSGTTEAQAKPVMVALQRLSNVERVSFISTDDGKNNFARDNKNDDARLRALTEASNRLPATIRIYLYDTSDTSELVEFVNTNTTLKKLISTQPGQTPTFMGERGLPTDVIASWTQTAQKIGVAATALFVAVSFLIIFNTIRMAIFNRRDEIEMMKLIGANKEFIRGPFLIEAIVYGVIAAVIATGIGLVTLLLMSERLQAWGVTIQPTIQFLTGYLWLVVLVMMMIGSVIGVVSSLLATRRYLKI